MGFEFLLLIWIVLNLGVVLLWWWILGIFVELVVFGVVGVVDFVFLVLLGRNLCDVVDVVFW